MIWAQVKGKVAAKNTFKVKDVRKLFEKALYYASVHDWKKCVKHAETLQEECFIKECVRGETIKKFVINLQDDSDSSFSENEDDLL
ncbi:uncharacterized protein NPIL_279941 [Nephila pilipes]|uniref:Uncharacterized protein n=1 Tax=Nephila pilipes TaxID=299642 RepID=A0A8X6TZY3_NEPPI|nr:uncharacterized protein NPIL_279941 [Nephila pilipes]